MKIYAFDFETSNPDYSSICQFGLAEFTDGKLTGTYETLIDPEDYFAEDHIDIHKIKPQDVIGKPKFDHVYEKLDSLIGYPILHHSSFDKSAYRQACEKYNLTPSNLTFMDTTMIVRRAWEQFRNKGYGLENVAINLGIKYSPHIAIEDAIACGKVFFEAVKHSGINEEDWQDRLKLRLDGSVRSYSNQISKEGNPDGEYFGQTVLFTGTANISRKELAELASRIGFKVIKNFSKAVNLLVVGLQDKSKLKTGHDRSSKHESAINFNKEGGNIRIISDVSFLRFFKDFPEFKEIANTLDK